MFDRIKDMREILSADCESTALWRWEKSLDFPDDERNLAASKLLSRMAKEIWTVPDACIERVIANVDNGDFGGVLMESLRLVGFSLHPETADEFLNQVLESCLSSA